MSLHEVRCLEVRCDGCGTYLLDDDYCVQRLDDEAQLPEALELMEWTLDRDVHRCPTCTCEHTSGHALKSWPKLGYRSCDCGRKYERAVTVKDRLERV